MSRDYIPDATIIERVINALRAVPSTLQVFGTDQSELSEEQKAAELSESAEPNRGVVCQYVGATSRDATEKGAGIIERAHRFNITAIVPVSQSRADGRDSEVVIRAMVEDMHRALDPNRSFGFGMNRVKHGFLTIPGEIVKVASETVGELHVAPCRLVVRHWYYVDQC